MKRRIVIVGSAVLAIAVAAITADAMWHPDRWRRSTRRGRDGKRNELPFKSAALGDLPRARTPNGSPLTLSAIAGSYGTGDLMGESFVVIRADGTSTNGTYSCFGTQSAENTVRVDDGRLVFDSRTLFGTETTVGIPVWWFGRIYLLGPDGDESFAGPLKFCNAINWGFWPEDRAECPISMRFMLLGREDKAVPPAADRTTSLPPELERLILKAPLDGVVIQEGARETARVNLGARDGVFVGMYLHASAEGWIGTRVKVTAVQETECDIVVNNPWASDYVGRVPMGAKVHCDAKGAEALKAK